MIGGIEMKWKLLGSTIDDSFIIDGVDIFKEKWKDTGIIVNLKDPLYGDIKTFKVWTVISRNDEITFAAGEFSNNVWGIYTEENCSAKKKSPISKLKKLFKRFN